MAELDLIVEYIEGRRSPEDFLVHLQSDEELENILSEDVRIPRMVKIFKSAEGSRPYMMDVEDEHNHMRSAFGLRYRIGQPATPAAE